MPDPNAQTAPDAAPDARPITQLLEAVGAGDGKAAGDLLPLVYDELRKLAQARMSKEPAQTLQPTALVHEAYLRLVGEADASKWNSRGHFFGAAAQAMRRIMVERARHAGRLRHGGGKQRVALDENAPAPPALGDDSADLLGLDEALQRLEAQDPRKAQVVMLRYFAGLTVEETAAALDLSPSMIKKEWTIARAWLFGELSRDRAMGAAPAMPPGDSG